MSTIRDAIRVATQDNKVTQEEWKSLKPLADATVLEASEEARDLVELFANDQFELEGSARTELRTVLRARGYDVPTARPTGMANADFVAKVIASNITETDQHLRTLQLRAGLEDATVNVGVVDTGLDTTHAALDTKLYTNKGEIDGDGIDNDNNGYVDDVHGFDFNEGHGVKEDAGSFDPSMLDGWHSGDERDMKDTHGHGTHVSGIITAGTESVDVMGLRVLGGNNFSGKMVVDAFDYAAKQGAKVINMSFMVKNPDDVHEIIEGMKAHPEILFVASAGNDGKDINSYDAASYLKKHTLDNFVVVSSADPDGKKASYSNYGQPWATHAHTGSDVLSTTPSGKFSAMSGTSMASPNAGAAAAKIMLMDPGLTPAQVKVMLADVTMPEEHWDPLVNAKGRIDTRFGYTLAAVTGLVRRDGLSPEAAIERLGLTADEATRVLPLVAKYVEGTGTGAANS